MLRTTTAALAMLVMLTGCIPDPEPGPGTIADPNPVTPAASGAPGTTAGTTTAPAQTGLKGHYSITKTAFGARLPEQAFYARLHIRFEAADQTPAAQTRAQAFFRQYAPQAKEAALTTSVSIGSNTSAEAPLIPATVLFNSDGNLPGDNGTLTTKGWSEGKYTPWIAVSPSSWMEVDFKLLTADEMRIDVFRNTVGQLSKIAGRFAANTWIGGFGADALKAASGEADQVLTGLVDPNGADRWDIQGSDLRFTFAGQPTRETRIELRDPKQRDVVLGVLVVTVEITPTMLSPEPVDPAEFDKARPIDASARLRSQPVAVASGAKTLADTDQYLLLTQSFAAAQFDAAAATAACERLRGNAQVLGLNTTDMALLVYEGMSGVMDGEDLNRKRTLFRSRCLSTADLQRLKGLGREFSGTTNTRLLNGDLEALGRYLTGSAETYSDALKAKFEPQVVLTYGDQPIDAELTEALADIRSGGATGFGCYVTGEGSRGFFLRSDAGAAPSFRVVEFDISRPYGERVDALLVRTPTEAERDRCGNSQSTLFSPEPRGVSVAQSHPATDAGVP